MALSSWCTVACRYPTRPDMSSFAAVDSLTLLAAGRHKCPCLVMQETYAYAKTLLDVATSNADGRTKALLVGGGIANFTDVAATFKGIIQVTLKIFCCCSCRHAQYSVCHSCIGLAAEYSSVVANEVKGKDTSQPACM